MPRVGLWLGSWVLWVVTVDASWSSASTTAAVLFKVVMPFLAAVGKNPLSPLMVDVLGVIGCLIVAPSHDLQATANRCLRSKCIVSI